MISTDTDSFLVQKAKVLCLDTLSDIIWERSEMKLISSSIESEIAQYLRSDNKTEYFVSFVVVTGKETRICPVSARISECLQ